MSTTMLTRIYVGTNTGQEDEGIYTFQFNTENWGMYLRA